MRTLNHTEIKSSKWNEFRMRIRSAVKVIRSREFLVISSNPVKGTDDWNVNISGNMDICEVSQLIDSVHETHHNMNSVVNEAKSIIKNQ